MYQVLWPPSHLPPLDLLLPHVSNPFRRCPKYSDHARRPVLGWSSWFSVYECCRWHCLRSVHPCPHSSSNDGLHNCALHWPCPWPSNWRFYQPILIMALVFLRSHNMGIRHSRLFDLRPRDLPPRSPRPKSRQSPQINGK